jgi:hypothetical protein
MQWVLVLVLSLVVGCADEAMDDDLESEFTHLAARTVCSPGFKCAALSGQEQKAWNWCGVAAVTSLFTNFGVSGVAQPDVANRILRDVPVLPEFGDPYKMADVINERRPSGKPKYEVHENNTNGELQQQGRRWIDRGLPFIITVHANRIWHPNAATGTAHYLVVYGYSDQAKGFMVWDPATSGGGSHHLAYADWEKVAYKLSIDPPGPGRVVLSVVIAPGN